MTICKLMKKVCMFGIVVIVVLMASGAASHAKPLQECPADLNCDSKQFQVRSSLPPYKVYDFVLRSAEVTPLRCQILIEVNAGKEKLPRHLFELSEGQAHIITVGTKSQKITCGKKAKLRLESFRDLD